MHPEISYWVATRDQARAVDASRRARLRIRARR